MNRSVWKFKLQPGIHTVEMPWMAEIMTAHEQFGEAFVWARVNPCEVLVKRRFEIVPTGGDVTYIDGEYIGSVFFSGGALVFHVFDLGWDRE